MASEGPLSGATFADDATVGTVAWNTPGNAAASDDTDSSAILVASAVSHYLKATNFGFAIPAGATIDGIVVEWEVAKTTGGTVDNAARIVKGGTIGSTDKSSVTAWTGTDTYLSHGGVSDLWGETWTADDINATTFGSALSAVNADPSFVDNPTIDHVRITVYYTEAATGRSRMSTLMCG